MLGIVQLPKKHGGKKSKFLNKTVATVECGKLRASTLMWVLDSVALLTAGVVQLRQNGDIFSRVACRITAINF